MDKEVIQRAITGYERLDITHIPENFTHESVLRKAFLDKAGTFMILPDSSGLLPHEEPDASLLSVFLRFQSHNSRNDLWLTSNS